MLATASRSAALALSAAIRPLFDCFPTSMPILSCDNTLIALDTESFNVIQKAPHPLFFRTSPHRNHTPHAFSDYNALRQCRVRHAKHRAFQIYALCMIAVYPLGIPVLFGILLFRNRKVLKNASLRTYNGEIVQQSTSCLWKPYKPSVFYYEVVECGRRLMLTGIMVFIYPNTTAQIAVTLAMAFIFALTSEGLNPYDSRVDTWVARIGHIMVVLTMFVALLTKVDVSGEGTQSQNMFAAILVTAHAAMVLTGVTEAVILICSVQQNDSPRPRKRNKAVLPVDNFSPIHVMDRESDR